MSDQTYATADDLTAPRAAETEEVTLPSNGKKVVVRGLTRFELVVSGKGTDDSALIERRNVKVCLVQPQLTMAQVEAWQRNPATIRDFQVVTEKIRELSGLSEGADKSDVQEVRD